MAARKINDVFKELAEYDDRALGNFQSGVRSILKSAKNKTVSRMAESIKIDRDVIRRSTGNSRALRSLAKTFNQEAEQAGLKQFLNAYAESFDGSLNYMNNIIDMIRGSVQNPLPKLNMSVSTKELANALKRNATASIRGVVNAIAAQAEQKILFSVGAMKFSDMVAVLETQLGLTVQQATTVAATAQSTFFRTIYANQLELTQKELLFKLRYLYAGPDDIKTRVFCNKELRRKSSITRRQIENLDNDQLPNPFITCGGYNCRHQWIVDMEHLAKAS